MTVKMGLSLRLLRFPRPQKFLYIMSLQTGASLITLSLLLNKVSGLYGLLAILTGFHLSPFQLSMYIYSVLALGLTAFLAPHIRQQTPFYCLALAWFYLLDSIINAAYTAAFGVTWFLVISQREKGLKPTGPGSSTMGDTAGFTSPKYNVSSVNVAIQRDDASASEGPASIGDGVLQPESFQSIAVVSTLWSIRIYFVFVMMAFARQCLREYAFNPKSRAGSVMHSRNPSTVSNVEFEANPFSTRSLDGQGQGWKGKLGRAMVSVGRSYWLEGDEEDGWMFGLNRKFHRNRNIYATAADTGLGERERRRRSGTGPPMPAHNVVNAVIAQDNGPLSPQGVTFANSGQPVKLQGVPENNVW